MEGLSSKLTNEAVESVLRVMSTQDGIRVAVFGELSAVATNLEAARKLVSDLPTKLATRGRTALWDAIEFRSRDFGEQGGTMLVVSDCGDNLSEISADELDRELRRRRVQVSFITLDEAFPQSLLDETGARDCLWLSSRTGGLTVRFQKLAEMDAVIRKLLRPYVFEVTVPRERATSKWKLKVTGNKPALRVTAPDRLPGCDD